MIRRSFYFLRHGQTDWNVVERLQGRTDIPLNDVGRTQAREAIAILQKYPIHRIVASPLSRAFETAEIVNETLKLPLEKHDGLKERHFGLFEGKTSAEYRAYRDANPSDTHEIPDAEDYALFNDRVIDAIATSLNKYADENVLFIGHGGVYRALSRYFFNDADHPKNSWPYHFILEDGTWTLKELA